MKNRPSRAAICLAAVLLAAGVTVASQIQDSFTSARELYSSAAYEDALAMLNRLRGPAGGHGQDHSIEQYRAFCLLALGRTTEAQHAIEVVVAAAPSFQPSETDASPRVRSMFSDVRRRMLPTIIQQEYAQAKGAFDRKEFATAAEAFRRVTDMLDDPDVGPGANQPPLSDLRTLAAGFRDLSVSALPPPPLPAVATTAPLPPSAPAAPPAPLKPRIYGAEDRNVVPPAVIRQVVPPFNARTVTLLQGALAVVVSEAGTVESAAMLLPTTKAYDRLVVESAIQWRYRPAMLDGVPVKFRRIVQINVSPTR